MNSTVLTGYNSIFITTQLACDIKVRSVSLRYIDVRECPTLHYNVVIEVLNNKH
jgi:hypothetical protein